MTPKVSKLNQAMSCFGSVKAQHDYPHKDDSLSQTTIEGMTCHDIFAKGLKVGDVDSRGNIVTPELYELTNVLIADVGAYCDVMGVDFKDLVIEQPVSLDCYSQGWIGVPDLWHYNIDEDCLTIWDAKYGFEIVEPYENWQLLAYALAISKTLPLISESKIVLKIVQPRSFHNDGAVRAWAMTRGDLHGYEIMLVDGLREMGKPNPTTRIGAHCKRCSAKVNCSNFSKTVYQGLEYVSTLQTRDMTSAELGTELKLLMNAQKLIGYMVSGIEENVTHLLKRGGSVPFFELVEVKPRDKWRKDVPVNEIIMMGDLMGLDLRKPVELNTPSQVRKLGVDSDTLSEYIEPRRASLKLSEIEADNAALIFNKQN